MVYLSKAPAYDDELSACNVEVSAYFNVKVSAYNDKISAYVMKKYMYHHKSNFIHIMQLMRSIV